MKYFLSDRGFCIQDEKGKKFRAPSTVSRLYTYGPLLLGCYERHDVWKKFKKLTVSKSKNYKCFFLTLYKCSLPICISPVLHKNVPYQDELVSNSMIDIKRKFILGAFCMTTTLQRIRTQSH